MGCLKTTMTSASVTQTVLIAFVVGSALQPSAAEPVKALPQLPPSDYYVEFRAAEMGLYGHSYIAYGRLAANGQAITVQYADFHPQGGDLGLALGHLVPVAASMGPEDATLKLPVYVSWRLLLTSDQYQMLSSAVSRARDRWYPWNALAYNCNSFVGEMAEAIGLRSPPPILFATSYIPELRRMNEIPIAMELRPIAERARPQSK